MVFLTPNASDHSASLVYTSSLTARKQEVKVI